MDGELVFWVFFLLALMPVAAAAGWLAGGVRWRRPPRPMPGLWWICSSCRSVNAPHRGTCYACAAALPDAPETLPTARTFSIVQRFGPQRPVEELAVTRSLGQPPALTPPSEDAPSGSPPSPDGPSPAPPAGP